MDFPALLILFFKAILIGLAIAAPVGPVGILCIRRSLSHKKLLAMMTSLGSACGDAFYASITAFSLASISALIHTYNFYLRFFGGLIMVIIGFSMIRTSTPIKKHKLEPEESPFHAFTSAFVLTLSNPVTLLAFAAAFTAMGISPHYHSFLQASSLVLGVFVGACSWWFILITFSHLMQHKLSDRQLLWINRFSGVILLGFAVYILISLA